MGKGWGRIGGSRRNVGGLEGEEGSMMIEEGAGDGGGVECGEG